MDLRDSCQHRYLRAISILNLESACFQSGAGSQYPRPSLLVVASQRWIIITGGSLSHVAMHALTFQGSSCPAALLALVLRASPADEPEGEVVQQRRPLAAARETGYLRGHESERQPAPAPGTVALTVRSRAQTQGRTPFSAVQREKVRR
jgi:hypothetical protein